jgi:hypothetical protein
MEMSFITIGKNSGTRGYSMLTRKQKDEIVENYNFDETGDSCLYFCEVYSGGWAIVILSGTTKEEIEITHFFLDDEAAENFINGAKKNLDLAKKRKAN